MMRSRSALVTGLVIPILALAALVAYKRHILTTGREVVLPIEGYDPRDLLAGHYLTYTVNYGVEGLCQGSQEPSPAYVCLSTHTSSQMVPENCSLYIRGRCERGRFLAGVERYYVPQSSALELEQKVRDKKASVVISVTPLGEAQVKDLWIDGRSWREN